MTVTPASETSDPAAPRPAATSREDDEAALQRALGARLRRARRARGLTLQDVEERSGGRWKAVVIGSYERGDRSVSAARLTELAAFLEVEVGQLLDDLQHDRPVGPRGAVRFDIAKLTAAAEDETDLEPLVRLVERVRWYRGDHRSAVIAVRHADIEAVAMVLGTTAERLTADLSARGVLAG